jgi:hypothetical protein
MIGYSLKLLAFLSLAFNSFGSLTYTPLCRIIAPEI